MRYLILSLCERESVHAFSIINFVCRRLNQQHIHVNLTSPYVLFYDRFAQFITIFACLLSYAKKHGHTQIDNQ